jgi:membrane protease YdiL (CAAX protease family)
MFYSRICGKDYTVKMQIKPFAPVKFLLLFYLLVLILLSNMLVNIGLYKLGLSNQELSQGTSFALAQMSGKVDPVYSIFAVALVPAICEEFVFRGVVFNEYREKGLLCAVVMSSLMFAMSHFDLIQFLPYFISSLLLCFAYTVTKSLVAPMVLHFFANLFSVFVMPYVWSALLQVNGILFVLLFAGTIGLFCVFLVFHEAQMIYAEYATTHSASVRHRNRSVSMTGLSKALMSPVFLCLVAIFVLISLSGK